MGMGPAPPHLLLRYWRRHHRLTQQGVATYLNTTVQTVGNWERGCSRIPFAAVLQLAEWWGVELGELMDGPPAEDTIAYGSGTLRHSADTSTGM